VWGSGVAVVGCRCAEGYRASGVDRELGEWVEECFEALEEASGCLLKAWRETTADSSCALPQMVGLDGIFTWLHSLSTLGLACPIFCALPSPRRRPCCLRFTGDEGQRRT
jgi:hypothetical protein